MKPVAIALIMRGWIPIADQDQCLPKNLLIVGLFKPDTTRVIECKCLT